MLNYLGLKADTKVQHGSKIKLICDKEKISFYLQTNLFF
jgi:hypothetical protein